MILSSPLSALSTVRLLQDAPDLAAVHLYGRAGHVGRRLRQQERAHAPELVGLAVTAHRDRRHGLPLGLVWRDPLLLRVDLVELADTVGIDPAGNDLVHADLLRRELEREGLGQRRDR